MQLAQLLANCLPTQMSLKTHHRTDVARYEAFLKLWGHLQHELLFLTWALMDAALLTPFIMGVMGWSRFWPPGLMLLWLLVLMLLAFNLARLLNAVQLPPQHQQTAMALALFLIVFLTLPTFFHPGSSKFSLAWIAELLQTIGEPGNNLWLRDAIVFGVIVLAWVRGLQLARREYSLSRAGLRLRVGGLILAPMVIWLANTRLLWDSSPYILLFFFAGLTAVALIRAGEIEKTQAGQFVALNPRWLTAVLLASLLTVFLAGALAAFVSGESASRLFGWLTPIWDGLRLTGSVAFTTLFFLLVPLLEQIDTIANFISGLLEQLSPWLSLRWAWFGKIVGKLFMNRRVPLLSSEDGGDPFDNLFIFEQVEGPGVALSRNGQLIIVLLAAAVILAAALLVGRRTRPDAVVVRAGRRRLAPKAGAAAAAENLLQRLLERLGLLRDWQTAASIRRVYQSMLRAAEASGYPRLEAETPYEFLSTLAKIWPDHQREIRLITSAYVSVRYGELPETKQELRAIQSAWQILEQTPPLEAVDRQPQART